MSGSVSEILSTINYGTSWLPDQELMTKVFISVTRNTFGVEPKSFYRVEDYPIFHLFMNENVIYWFWDTFPAEREKFLPKLITYFNYERYDYSTNRNISAIVPPHREAIIKIFTDCFDAIPDNSESVEDQGLRISLSSLPINRSIDYAAKMMEANISGNKALAEYWKRMGLERSTDPAVYSMAWSKIERSQGYTDRRSNIIRAASRCLDYPETIISDLINAGHNKNRSALISIFTERISEAKRGKNLHANKNIPSVQEDYDNKIRYCQSVLAKFVGCEDLGIMQQLIPFLRSEDLIFAAPTAASLGLQRLLDRYMNGEEEKSQSYRY